LAALSTAFIASVTLFQMINIGLPYYKTSHLLMHARNSFQIDGGRSLSPG
jgi:hypothetical protein